MATRLDERLLTVPARFAGETLARVAALACLVYATGASGGVTRQPTSGDALQIATMLVAAGSRRALPAIGSAVACVLFSWATVVGPHVDGSHTAAAFAGIGFVATGASLRYLWGSAFGSARPRARVAAVWAGGGAVATYMAAGAVALACSAQSSASLDLRLAVATATAVCAAPFALTLIPHWRAATLGTDANMPCPFVEPALSAAIWALAAAMCAPAAVRGSAALWAAMTGAAVWRIALARGVDGAGQRFGAAATVLGIVLAVALGIWWIVTGGGRGEVIPALTGIAMSAAMIRALARRCVLFARPA